MNDSELLEFASHLSMTSAFDFIQKEQGLTVYTFLYNPCIHESGWITMSAHLSKANAFKEMKRHKTDAFNEWRNRSKYFRQSIKFGLHRDWAIGTLKILP